MSIGGTLLIILCYVFPSFWGVFIEIEVVILGISIYSARKGTTNLAKDFFRQKGIFYTVIGIVVIGFGIAYKYADIQAKFSIAKFFMIYCFQ